MVKVEENQLQIVFNRTFCNDWQRIKIRSTDVYFRLRGFCFFDYADLYGLCELYSSKEVFCTKKKFVFDRCKTPPELQKERCGIKFFKP